MEKKNDFGYVAVIAILIGAYLIVSNEFVYKHEQYYLGDSIITKKITVQKDPFFIKGNLFKSAHYNIISKEYQCRFQISYGSLAQVSLIGSPSEIEAVKKNDSLTIKVRIKDVPLLLDSSGKIRIIDLVQNNKQLITAAAVEKYDRKSYHTSLGFGIVLLILGILWVLALAFRKKSLN